jgi:hypothetical protein
MTPRLVSDPRGGPREHKPPMVLEIDHAIVVLRPEARRRDIAVAHWCAICSTASARSPALPQRSWTTANLAGADSGMRED